MEAVLKDNGFRIESASASAALHAAKELSEWMSNPENIPATVAFSEQLTTTLQLAIAKHPVNRCEREKVWGSFHKLRCSEAFKAEWEGFLHRSTTIRPDPTFYQYVVGVIFKQILKLHCQIVGSARTQEDCHLSYEDKNAVRYAAGYVPRALAKKLRKSAHPLKEELTLCLFELVDDADDSHDESQDWVNMIDRGGLKHVNNTTYMVFASMELVVRRYIQPKMPANFKQDTKDHALRDEDVLFYWAMVSADWEEEESRALLSMIVDLWITIRGFSFASTWMEKYKIAHQKAVQKSKGLRKQLLAPPSSSHS